MCGRKGSFTINHKSFFFGLRGVVGVSVGASFFAYRTTVLVIYAVHTKRFIEVRVSW